VQLYDVSWFTGEKTEPALEACLRAVRVYSNLQLLKTMQGVTN